MKYIRTLDGVRGVAALLVLLAHFPQIGDGILGKAIKSLAVRSQAAYIGVDIFFVLSGFLITRILLSEKIKGNFSFKKFYFKRSLRIFPIYYLVILFCFIFQRTDGKDIWYSAVYLSNYFFAFNGEASPLRHTWSLAVEEHYYLLWPLILFLFPINRSRIIVTYVLPILALASALGTELFTSPLIAQSLIMRGSQYRIFSLCLGSIIAFHETKIQQFSFRKILVLSSLGLIFSSLIFLQKIPIYEFRPAMNLIGYSIFSLTFVFFILACEFRDISLVKSIFSNPVLVYIGKISYGIYLYHFLIFFYLGVTNDQISHSISIQMGIWAFFLCIITPIISFHLIEKPILDFKNRFYKYSQTPA